MEQDNTNRTLEELCNDINLRAEKLFIKFSKVEKWGLLLIAVLFLAPIAINWHLHRSVDWWWVGAGCALVVFFFVFYIINQRLINGMKRAANVKQHLRLAKRLSKCVRFRNFFFIFFQGCICGIHLVNNEFEWGWFLFGLIIAVIVTLCITAANPKMLIDPAFSEDLDELEYRLEE
jgi:hypothetical protein